MLQTLLHARKDFDSAKIGKLKSSPVYGEFVENPRHVEIRREIKSFNQFLESPRDRRIIHPSYIFNLRVPSIEKITSDPRLLR